MDLRDQFAMAAVQGLLAGDIVAYEEANAMYWKDGEFLVDELAKDAYKLADAMIRIKASGKKAIPIPTSMPPDPQ